MSSQHLDYDLFVIDSSNRDTTLDQLRDCLYDVLDNLIMRVENLESALQTQAAINNKLKGGEK